MASLMASLMVTLMYTACTKSRNFSLGNRGGMRIPEISEIPEMRVPEMVRASVLKYSR